jgi:type IV pilus assembly protein PilA
MQDIMNRLRNKKADEGFTLIELLVVVVIIGVLVAIAVPVYLNYRKGAADKSAQSDVRGAVSAVEQFYTDNGNTYPATVSGANDGSATGTASLGLSSGATGATASQTITLSDKTRLGFNRAADGLTYTICGNNTGGSGKWYVYNSAAGGSVKASTVSTPSLTTC